MASFPPSEGTWCSFVPAGIGMEAEARAGAAAGVGKEADAPSRCPLVAHASCHARAIGSVAVQRARGSCTRLVFVRLFGCLSKDASSVVGIASWKRTEREQGSISRCCFVPAGIRVEAEARAGAAAGSAVAGAGIGMEAEARARAVLKPLCLLCAGRHSASPPEMTLQLSSVL